MITVLILVAALLIFAWGWRRVYLHNIRKGARKAVAQTLGVIIGLFPALFFFYACFATFPPSEMVPPSTVALAGLWVIFIVMVILLLYLTTRPVRQPDNDGIASSGVKPKE